MIKPFAVLIILMIPFVMYAEIIYVTGKGTVEIFSKYNIFPDYSSSGYKQEVSRRNDGYHVKISSHINDIPVPVKRYRQNPKSTGYNDKDIIDLVGDITKNSYYLSDAIEKLVFWVRENIRYNPLIMTVKPKSMRKILLDGEGTCVDIVFILSELFDAAGINNNIMRGAIIDDNSMILHRWLEFEGNEGEFIQLDPLSSVFFITPNHLFIKRDSRYSAAYHDFPVSEKLEQIELLRTDYSFSPVGKIANERVSIMIGGKNYIEPYSKSGIVIFDSNYSYTEIIIRGKDENHILSRDKILTFSVFGLEKGRYDIYYRINEYESLLKTIFIRDGGIYFAGR